MRTPLRPVSAGLVAFAALALAGLVTTSTPVRAETTLGQRPAIVGASVMRWLNPAQKRTTARSKSQRKAIASRMDSRHGRGSYICSASGSGSRAYCFAR